MEIIIMEFAFELIREAGLRVPSPIGPTLGIIGALILGQAAVAANIVSPILIIVVAVTGIGSFAIPNFSMGFSFRILRFVYVFLAAIAGFWVLLLVYLCKVLSCVMQNLLEYHLWHLSDQKPRAAFKINSLRHLFGSRKRDLTF
nr:spore germination protein [Acetivibrio straminisolvens]